MFDGNEVTEELLLFSMEGKVGKLPPDLDDKNNARAETALRTIRSFSQDFGESIDKFDGEEQIGVVQQNAKDLLTDLAHLFDRLGLDYNGVLDNAKRQYADKTQKRGEQFVFLTELENLRGSRDSL